MVSEAEFDKNQKKFRETLAQAQTTATAQSGTTQPLGLPIPGSPTSTIPATDEFGNPVQLPAGTGGIQNFAADPLQAGLMIGGGGPGLGVRGGAGIVNSALGNLKRRGLTVLLAPLLAFFAGASGVANSIIGKEWNRFSSDNNLNQGDLALKAFQDMYTTPVEVGGKWKFLFNDGKKLQERMRDAGINAEEIPLRMIQLDQIRNSNKELIAASGEPADFEDEQIPGETAIETADRLAKENFEQQAALNAPAPGNRQGMTVAQVEAINQEFERGRIFAGEPGERTAEEQERLRAASEGRSVAELTRLPPGQLTPTEQEKIIKAKTPNAPAASTTKPSAQQPTPQEQAERRSVSGGSSQICPPGFIWDNGLKRCVRDTGASRL